MSPKGSQRSQRYVHRGFVALLIVAWGVWFWTKDISSDLRSAPDRPGLPLLSPDYPDTRPEEGQDPATEETTTDSSSAPASGDLPPEYLALSEDQQQCEDIFGNSYITNIARTSQENCAGGSPSALHCFYAQRLWNRWVPWKRDPLYLAQGIKFTS